MLRIGVSLLLAVMLGALSASAQDFPNRPVKIIVPFPPGGPVDVLARGIGEGFRERTGQPMIVENRPGANTSIGATACKNADPDGYTVCLLTGSTITLNPFLYPSLPYAPEKDLEPVSNVVIARQVLLVHRSNSRQHLCGARRLFEAESRQGDLRLVRRRRGLTPRRRMAQEQVRIADDARALSGRGAGARRFRTRRHSVDVPGRDGARRRADQVRAS